MQPLLPEPKFTCQHSKGKDWLILIIYWADISNNLNFRTIYDNCKILNDSQHFDALLDFIKIGWAYSKALPKFDIESHNNYQRDCFKLLANYTKIALKTGGANLGKERLENFKGQLESMLLDIKSDELLKCQDLLKNIFKSITDNQG